MSTHLLIRILPRTTLIPIFIAPAPHTYGNGSIVDIRAPWPGWNETPNVGLTLEEFSPDAAP